MTEGAGGTAIPLVTRDPADILFRKPGRGLTAADFLRDVAHAAARLPQARHLLNLCQDRYAFTVAFAAAVLRGQVSLLTSDRSPDRLRALAERFGDTGSVTDDPATESPVRNQVLELFTGPATDAPANPAIPATRLAAIVFTSGSTGEPVANRKLWGALADRSADGGARFGMHPARPAAVVGTVPPQHMYGFETTVLLPLHAAASSWCGPGFYPGDVAAALAAVPAPRVLVTTPLQLRALLQAGLDLPPLERIISATAPLDPAMAGEAEQRWNTEVWEIFGATEVGSIASRRTIAGEVWTTYDRVRLQPAPDDGVLVTAPYAEPCALADMVEMLDPGHFRLLGRGGDLIKLGGRRASLAGLNRILNRIPGVRDGVFVVPDDLDRRPTARLAVFVVSPDRDPDAILADLRREIDPVFLPRRVVRVDALPRNDVGKLPRGALAALQVRAGAE